MGVNYQLKRGGVNTGSLVAGTGAAISFGNQTTAGIYTVVAVNPTTNCETNMTGSANVEAYPTSLTPSVAITANPSGTIYTVSSVTFTAVPTNGGTTPQYQWQKNGMNVGTNSATYTDASWTNGDVVTCILTSNNACAVPTTATSNSIVISATAPPAGTALNFDGTDDYVSINTGSSSLSGSFTVECWIKPTSFTNVGNPTLFSSRTPTEFGLDVQLTASGNLHADIGNGSGFITTSADATANFVTDTWYHIALVVTPTGYTYYKDGVNIGSSSFSGTPLLFDAAHTLVLGAIGPNPSGSSFQGLMDEFRIWNVARSEAEIANNRSCELVGNETGLVAYYKFNQGIDADTNTGLTTLTDATANANNGTLNNFALTGATSNWVSGGSSVGAPVTPSVSIAASPSGAITAGTSVTFTATPTNGGAAPTYIWKKGGIAIGGEVSATYTSNTLANGDIITCEMTSNAACATTATATSTGITMSVTSSSTYTWTGATSTDWATPTNWTPNGIPTSTDNVIIPTTINKPMLPANQTIANMDLTGTNKVLLGNSTLCVNAITGGSSSSYVVTDGTGSLIIKALPTDIATTFPIGVSETSYDPIRIQPTNSVDFAAKVKTTANAADFSGSIANFLQVAPRQWDITPTGSAGSTVLTFTNGGTPLIPTDPKVGHYLTVWEELAATYSDNTWTTTTTSFSPFGVGDAGGFTAVVPVELLFFKGYHKDGVNILNWQTASELNNEGFNIERSEDAKSWKTLGFVKGNGTTVETQNYTFLDEQPAVGVSYYRLQQLDFDGQYEYSDIISLNNTSKGTKKELIVYPNPTSGTFQVQLPESNATVQLYNGQGSLVKEVIANSTNFQLHMADLPAGAYLLKVQTGKQVWTQRVVVE